jgi:hypothetical protein
MGAALAAAKEPTDAVQVGEPTVATPIVTAAAEPTRVMSPVRPEAKRATVPSRVETRTENRPRRLTARAKWLVAAAAVTILLVAVVVSTRDSNTAAPSKTPTLEQAINDLDQAVQP